MALRIAGVELTHPDRVLYGDQGLTKTDLASYYRDVAEWIVPHLEGRPLTLVRCPEGQDSECFYQKHPMEGFPEAVRRVSVAGEDEEYLVVDDVEGLISLVQMGVLEIHVWNARRDDLERPDRMLFDLDPGPGVEPGALAEAARHVRERLKSLGLRSFAKTTGGKGLHIHVPLQRRDGWDAVRSFARAVAEVMAEEEPERYVVKSSKEEREGRIYVDYLRNAVNATAVAPYSTRARHGAPVAVPLRWDEVTSGLDPAGYDVSNTLRRLGSLRSDPWSGRDPLRQSLTDEMKKELGLA